MLIKFYFFHLKKKKKKLKRHETNKRCDKKSATSNEEQTPLAKAVRTATATIDDPEAVTQATQQMAHAAEDASKRRLRRKGQADSATPTRNQAVASVAAVGLAAQVEELKQMVSEYEETNKQLESRINELEAENRKLAAANRESEKKKKSQRV